MSSRDEKTAEAHKYYEKPSPITSGTHILILDPMISTGGTARLVLTTLLDYGAFPFNIALIGAIASTDGIASIKAAFSDVQLQIVATDHRPKTLGHKDGRPQPRRPLFLHHIVDLKHTNHHNNTLLPRW